MKKENLWKKLGLLFCAENETKQMQIGGRAPVALHLEGPNYKIFFGAFDSNGVCRIFCFDYNFASKKISNFNKAPLIDIGNIGFYNDNGVIPSCVLKHNNKIYLYTIGFSLKNKIIFDASAGLAISEDNGKTFDHFNGPILDRSIYDPCFATCPFVLFDENLFKMWYVSCDKWEKTSDQKLKHYYNIKYKESLDGIHWTTKASTAIDYKDQFEYAISRPCVIKNCGLYKMWYSFREQKHIKTYRIGYAESNDGRTWTRKDSTIKYFDVSKEGWDSEMMCYPYVFQHHSRLIMLYNGNNYGRSGFGAAEKEM